MHGYVPVWLALLVVAVVALVVREMTRSKKADQPPAVKTKMAAKPRAKPKRRTVVKIEKSEH